MNEKLKAWAWSRPTFEDPKWDRVDEIVDRDLKFMFENKYVEHLVQDIDKAIAWLENKASAIANAMKEAK